jgi:hypothetical protein
MRTHSSAITAVLAAALAACGGETKNTTDAIVVRDSAGVTIVENDLTRLDGSCSLGATPTISIGEEDAGEEYELQGVSGARRLADGGIVFGHQTTWQVRFYGADGRYIRSAGRQGEGPGEFTGPFGLYVVGDTIYAGNSRPFQYLVFTSAGDWVRTVRPTPLMTNPARASGILSDGRMMLAIEDVGARAQALGEFLPETRTVQLHAADGALIDTIATLPHGRSGRLLEKSSFYTMPMFESYSHATARDSIIVLGHGAQEELRVFIVAPGAEPRLARLIRWTDADRQVTSADIDAEKAREKRDLDNGNPQSRPMREEMYRTNTHSGRPIAEVMPSMNGIRLGVDGRIWIRQYQPPADTSPRRWVAFTRAGRFDCRLQAPDYGVEEMGADYMLVTERDSLGVQRVKQFPISRN